MARLSSPSVLLATAALLLAGSATWFGLVAPKSAARGASGRPAPTNAYAPTGRDAPKVQAEVWAPPPAQHRGPDWVYDVFSPPEIFYNDHTKEFSISPPQLELSGAGAAAEPPAPFGLELVTTKRPLYRLQLVGYVGGEGSYRGLFENALTSETFLATAGRRLPALAILIEEFAVRRQPVTLPDSLPTTQPVATALVRDERTGERITLTNGARFYAGAALAVLQPSGAGEAREVRAGEEIAVGETVFRIDKIELTPAAVDVTKKVPGHPAESRTLSLTNPPPTATPPSRD